jgi:hypothetical protein
MRHLLQRLALSCLLAAACLPARGTISYVNGTATGSVHDGASWASAYLTIDDALQAAHAGDDVLVATGAYYLGATVPAGVSLYGSFAGNEADVRSRHGEPHSSVLYPKGRGFPVVAIAQGAGPETVFNGFKVVSFGSEADITFTEASPTLTDNVFTRQSFYFSPPLLEKDLLFCNGYASPTIAGNLFSGATAHAIDCGGGNPVILNNTVVGNEDGGIVLFGYSRAWVENNILMNNDVGVWSENPELTVVRDNCFYDNVSSDYTGRFGPMPIDGTDGRSLPVFGNISADPRFAAAALGDYRLQPDSPCVDAGSAVGPSGEPYKIDLGAYPSNGQTLQVTPKVVRVSVTGDDANDGATWQTAKRTITAAVDAVRLTGGEVWVAEGEYADDSLTYRMGSISVPDYVALYGGFAGAETSRDERDWTAHPTILADHQHSDGVIVSSAGRWNSRVDGFVIKADRQPGQAGGTGIRLKYGSPIIGNCTVTGEGQDVTLIAGQSSSPLITHATLMDAASTGAPIAVAGLSPVFANDVIQNNSSQLGAVIDASRSRAWVLKDSLLNGNHVEEGNPLFRPASVVTRMTNNTFVNNDGTAYYVPRDAPSVVANNIYAFNTGAVTDTLLVSPQGRDNCVYPAGSAPIRDANGNIAADPLFVDAEHGDYRLADGSPCIDAGDSSVVSMGDVDLSDGPRLQGRRVDMGAYESSATAPAPNFLDALDALKIAAGFRAATPAQSSWLNVDPASGGISISDAAALLKALTDGQGTR